MTASVGGTTWVAGVTEGVPVHAYLDSSGALVISGWRFVNDLASTSTYITIVIPNFADAGAYQLGDSAAGSARAQYLYASCINCFSSTAQFTSHTFTTTSSSVGLVTIHTFDRERQTVSGSFQFDAKDVQTPSVLAVRSGTFEMAWSTP
jgi:hypothetical protein